MQLLLLLLVHETLSLSLSLSYGIIYNEHIRWPPAMSGITYLDPMLMRESRPYTSRGAVIVIQRLNG